MNKFTLYICLICLLHTRSNGQESEVAVPVKKTELSSYKDIKPFLALAYPDKNYSTYGVNSFNITCTTTKNNITTTFTEASTCGNFTEKQLSLLEKYSKPGSVFVLREIILKERGTPGSPYNPSATTISVPDILFTIKE